MFFTSPKMEVTPLTVTPSTENAIDQAYTRYLNKYVVRVPFAKGGCRESQFGFVGGPIFRMDAAA